MIVLGFSKTNWSPTCPIFELLNFSICSLYSDKCENINNHACNASNIQISSFYEFFVEKFSEKSGAKTPVIISAEDDVNRHFGEQQSLTMDRQPFYS